MNDSTALINTVLDAARSLAQADSFAVDGERQAAQSLELNRINMALATIDAIRAGVSGNQIVKANTALKGEKVPGVSGGNIVVHELVGTYLTAGGGDPSGVQIRPHRVNALTADDYVITVVRDDDGKPELSVSEKRASWMSFTTLVNNSIKATDTDTVRMVFAAAKLEANPQQAIVDGLCKLVEAPVKREQKQASKADVIASAAKRLATAVSTEYEALGDPEVIREALAKIEAAVAILRKQVDASEVTVEVEVAA